MVFSFNFPTGLFSYSNVLWPNSLLPPMLHPSFVSCASICLLEDSKKRIKSMSTSISYFLPHSVSNSASACVNICNQLCFTNCKLLLPLSQLKWGKSWSNLKECLHNIWHFDLNLHLDPVKLVSCLHRRVRLLHIIEFGFNSDCYTLLFKSCCLMVHLIVVTNNIVRCPWAF